MMKFENAPLIELIVELRWGAPSVTFPQAILGQPSSHANVTTHADDLVIAFGQHIAEAGYVMSEKLFPPGMPIVAFQTSHRFRKPISEAAGTSLFGIGAGVFSVNITPPYKSWSEFRPIVEIGINALLKSRIGDSAQQPFVTVSLRYVNAFGSDLMGEKSASDFLQMLGFGVTLPSVLDEMIDSSKPFKPMLLLNLPLTHQRNMNVNVGHAFVNGQESVLMDNVVASSMPVAPELSTVMTELDNARALIHKFFVESTRPISHLLQPSEE
ncbi:TIGR04255 family protein [Robbsia sp. Bb-Pol-6]|uniref:TIGR04255 family protein n=1 Tax=Robbsia betulipollinis TaxID=2981849 RepID=A0ABT3ZRN0_9BURK|nr:TIGR04255 family protein [Robbsia betulipollinis]MCY0389142.1 TIGR04255 family protein [Robbsia betulipollinis]